MAVNNRTNQNQGCPVCSRLKRGKSRVANIVKDKGSLALNNPDLLKEWDYEKNSVSPNKISSGSKKIAWWKCPVCKGSWQAQIYNRTKTNGTKCPYCSGKKVLKGFNDFMTKHPVLAKEWIVEKNDGLLPSDYSEGSSQKIVWTCNECGNEWIASIYNRTRGRGCPKCAKYKVAKKNAKRVICLETNVVFDSVKDAASWAKIADSTLVGCLKGKQKIAGGFHWKYLDN